MAEQKKVLFTSKFKNHKIIIMPSTRTYNSFGQAMFKQGIKAEFKDYIFETSDPKIIKALKEHKRYGVYFHSDEVEKTEIEETNQEEAEKEKKAVEDKTLTSCPHCSFNAKSNFGLQSHIRSKHPEKSK